MIFCPCFKVDENRSSIIEMYNYYIILGNVGKRGAIIGKQLRDAFSGLSLATQEASKIVLQFGKAMGKFQYKKATYKQC